MEATAHAPNQSTATYHKTLSFDDESLISEHCIGGVGVFPAAAQVEMVLAGLQDITRANCFRLWDINFINPIRITPGDTLSIEVTFFAQSKGWAVSLKSTNKQGYIEHFSGKADKHSQIMPKWHTLSTLRRSFDHVLEPSYIQEWYRSCGIEYGPSFRTVSEITFGKTQQNSETAHEALILLRDGQNSQASPFILKPNLLDGGLQALGMLLEKIHPSESDVGIYLPYYLSELKVYAPLYGTVWCLASELSLAGQQREIFRGQLTFMNAQGQILAEVKSATLKRILGAVSTSATDPIVHTSSTGQEFDSTPQTDTSPKLEDYFHSVDWRTMATASNSKISVVGNWLLFSDSGALSIALAQGIKQRGGRCIEILAGRSFQKINIDNYRIDPTRAKDYQQLLESVADSGPLVGAIHAWQTSPVTRVNGFASITAELEEGAKSCILLSQALGKQSRTPMRFILVTTDAQRVTENTQRLIPGRSAMWGVGRTVAQEYRHLRTSCIDVVGDEVTENSATVAEKILEEALQTQTTIEIAFRAGQRYVPELRPVQLRSNQVWKIRRNGTYLISGGLGEIGITIAEYLAEQGAGKLILVNRSQYFQTQKNLSESERRRQRLLDRIRQRGVELLTPQGDVTDFEFAHRLVQTEGPVHGIVHCAGVLRDGLIYNKSMQDVEQVLAPKVRGTLSLAAAVDWETLDFFVLFSSLSAVLGNIGQADYAAANAFLDAYANDAYHLCKYPVMALDWGPWGGMGMLASNRATSSNIKEFESIDAELGCALFDCALSHPHSQLVIFHPKTSRPLSATGSSFSSTTSCETAEAIRPQDSLAEHKPTSAFEANAAAISAGAEVVVSEPADSAYSGSESSANTLAEKLRNNLVKAYADALSVPAEQFDFDTDLLSLGLNSLMVLEIKATLESSDFSLDPSIFFLYPTINELSQYLLETYPKELENVFGVGYVDHQFNLESNHESNPVFHQMSTTTNPKIKTEKITSADPLVNYLPEFLRHRIDELSAEDVESVEKGEYFYEPVIRDTQGAWATVGDRKMLILASYSYLNLIGHPKINAAAQTAIDQYGTGTHGVRLLAGTNMLHRELEQAIARFKQTEDAVVFSSGFITNVTTVSALLNRGDVMIGDMFNHASIVDGCIQSGAKFLMFDHNDMGDLERCLVKAGDSNKLVVVDAVFSMDGDVINLPEVVRLCKYHCAALMVDEAHSLGVLGATGRGIEEYFRLPPGSIDIKMGTLSKTIPSVGGYIAGCRELVFALKNNARAFIFSAALPPAQAAAAITALQVIQDEPERLQRLQLNIRRYIDTLKQNGFHTHASETAIVPIFCDTAKQAVQMAHFCQSRNIFVQPIIYPAVPINAPRLRTIITAAHTSKDIGYALDVLVEAGNHCGLIQASPSISKPTDKPVESLTLSLR